VDSLLQEYFGALDVECFVVVFIKAALLRLKPGNGSCYTINLSSEDLALKVLHFSLLVFPSLFLAFIFFSSFFLALSFFLSLFLFAFFLFLVFCFIVFFLCLSGFGRVCLLLVL
jgi:hypothetical protein